MTIRNNSVDEAEALGTVPASSSAASPEGWIGLGDAAQAVVYEVAIKRLTLVIVVASDAGRGIRPRP